MPQTTLKTVRGTPKRFQPARAASSVRDGVAVRLAYRKTVKKRVPRFGEKTTKKGADVDEYTVRLMNDPMEQKNEKTQQIRLLRLVNAPAASPKKSRKPRSRVFR